MKTTNGWTCQCVWQKSLLSQPSHNPYILPPVQILLQVSLQRAVCVCASKDATLFVLRHRAGLDLGTNTAVAMDIATSLLLSCQWRISDHIPPCTGLVMPVNSTWHLNYHMCCRTHGALLSTVFSQLEPFCQQIRHLVWYISNVWNRWCWTCAIPTVLGDKTWSPYYY